MNIFDVYIQVENYFFNDVVIFTSDTPPLDPIRILYLDVKIVLFLIDA